METKREIWKAVEEYKYLYVSNLGRVKRIGHTTKGIYYRTEYLSIITEIGDSDTDSMVTIPPRVRFYEETMKIGRYTRYGGLRSIDYNALMKKYWGFTDNNTSNS